MMRNPMRHRLFSILSAFSLLVGAALAGLWIDSHRQRTNITLSSWHELPNDCFTAKACMLTPSGALAAFHLNAIFSVPTMFDYWNPPIP